MCLNVVSMLSVACVLAVNFEVYTLSNSDTVCDECCVLTCTSDTHLRRLFVVISVMNSQYVSFRTPPQIHCRLTPICVWMCFQRSALRAFLLWISKCITIEFWQCLWRMLCAYMYLGHASLTTIRRDFGHEFTGGKFPNPPPHSL